MLGVFAAWYALPLRHWLENLTGWIDGLGTIGYVYFAALYAVGTVLLVPGATMTLAAGLAFGLSGFAAAWAGAVIGATLAFVISRHVARGLVAGHLEDSQTFRAIDSAIGEESWRLVLLLRLSPVFPFNLQNYAHGITAISLPSYVVATAIGIVPGTLMYVYLGAAGQATLAGAERSPLTWALFTAGLAATIAVTVLVTRRARAKLRKRRVEPEG